MIETWACSHCGELFPSNKPRSHIFKDVGFCSTECQDKGITINGCSSQYILQNKITKRCTCDKCISVSSRKREGPVFKNVTYSVPHCPRCGHEMKRAAGDIATMFNYECSSWFCTYVC